MSEVDNISLIEIDWISANNILNYRYTSVELFHQAISVKYIAKNQELIIILSAVRGQVSSVAWSYTDKEIVASKKPVLRNIWQQQFILCVLKIATLEYCLFVLWIIEMIIFVIYFVIMIVTNDHD